MPFMQIRDFQFHLSRHCIERCFELDYNESSVNSWSTFNWRPYVFFFEKDYTIKRNIPIARINIGKCLFWTPEISIIQTLVLFIMFHFLHAFRNIALTSCSWAFPFQFNTIGIYIFVLSMSTKKGINDRWQTVAKRITKSTHNSGEKHRSMELWELSERSKSVLVFRPRL